MLKRFLTMFVFTSGFLMILILTSCLKSPLEKTQSWLESYGVEYSLEELERIQSLELSDSDIEDIHILENLSESLVALSLESTQVMDISVLGNFRLQYLDLSSTSISNDSLKNLYNQNNLISLEINNNRINDIGFLTTLSELEYLDISRTGIYDLSFIRNMENLEYLDISFTGISDISALKNNNSIESLNISGTYVSDYSCLFSMENLETLDVTGLGFIFSDMELFRNHDNLRTIKGLHSNRDEVLNPPLLVLPEDGLNMRSQPTVSSEILYTIPGRAEVQLIAENPELEVINNRAGHWSYILHGNNVGWVFGAYIQPYEGNWINEAYLLYPGKCWDNIDTSNWVFCVSIINNYWYTFMAPTIAKRFHDSSNPRLFSDERDYRSNVHNNIENSFYEGSKVLIVYSDLDYVPTHFSSAAYFEEDRVVARGHGFDDWDMLNEYEYQQGIRPTQSVFIGEDRIPGKITYAGQFSEDQGPDWVLATLDGVDPNEFSIYIQWDGESSTSNNAMSLMYAILSRLERTDYSTQEDPNLNNWAGSGGGE